MTAKQEQIIECLRSVGEPMTPTEIGEACGRPYHSASAWASSGLKALVANGSVIRHATARYEIAKGAAA